MPTVFSVGIRSTPGGSARGAGGSHLLAPARSPLLFLPRLGQEAGAAGKNSRLLFCAPAVSLLLSWKHVSTAGSGSPRAGIITWPVGPKCGN